MARLPTAEKRLPYVAEMGFNVVYLPPIHPDRDDSSAKGRTTILSRKPGDDGSPWAIGAGEGRAQGDPRRSGDGGGFQAICREG